MKINNIKNTFRQTIPSKAINKIKDGVMTLGLISVATGGIYVGKQLMERAENSKELVKQYNPDKYNQMVETNKSDADWYQAAADIRDSLQQDSIAKANYAKGIQAVRDSLKNAKP